MSFDPLSKVQFTCTDLSMALSVIFYIGFNPDLTRNMYSMTINVFTPLSKLWLSVSRFS